MNFPIRGAVYFNIQDMSSDEMKNMINDSIQGEEKLLPGLGVVFEVIWENSSQQEKDQMVETLHQNIPREKAQAPVSPS
ncbi:MAG: small acid-soluble spore protein SspI [Firmicutes bacterium]|uniref:Small, acid-soluble spore protein I n=1 Tax=Melghirimyces thermohalophilus TaxID=1236220 RepID=A0A1G6MQP0_9BACL|nr:small acid-soluble spore protein SspI [Melghirimyces thermohalophilus]MDA8354546.1 small acid-soluble spore protein SspI [Bacillota bacterium]SDC57873.1 small acid-soluble spore protein I (minor) [Melghirimyces thermohalophilus]